MIVEVANWLGDGFLGMGLVLALRGRRQLAAALYAIGGFNFYVGAALAHDVGDQIWQAAWTTYWAWLWWQGGGGDKTKRRLKKLARKFTPVRRAAPQLT